MVRLFLAFLFLIGASAFATNVRYESDVVSAVSPYETVSSHVASDYNDVVSACHSGGARVRFVAVANDDHCSYGQLVSKVKNKNVQVVVGHQVVQKSGFTGYNQTRVDCNEVRVVKGKVVRRRVGRVFFRRPLFQVRRQVVVAVDSCR